MESLPEKGGGLISLPCGAGKTVISLYIISLIKKKTIILVHKDFLMNQWYDRIKQFLPSARIGKIQQNTIDVADKDIVLAMVQSISMKVLLEDYHSRTKFLIIHYEIFFSGMSYFLTFS